MKTVGAKARAHVVKVRLTESERASVRASARAEGITLSAYLRRLAVTARAPIGTEDRRVKRALALIGSLTRGEADQLRASVREVREGWDRGGR
jgi:hypothetical protein